MDIYNSNINNNNQYNMSKSEELYESKLANPDDRQISLDRKTKTKLRLNSKFIEVNTLAELIFYFFLVRYSTYYIYALGLTRIQCPSNRARSIDDAYLCCRGYGIDITLKQLKEVVEYLYSPYIIKGAQYILRRSFCSTVRKRVHSCNPYITIKQLTELLEPKGWNYGIKEEVSSH